jgi:hypothetical protein
MMMVIWADEDRIGVRNSFKLLSLFKLSLPSGIRWEIFNKYHGLSQDSVCLSVYWSIGLLAGFLAGLSPLTGLGVLERLDSGFTSLFVTLVFSFD